MSELKNPHLLVPVLPIPTGDGDEWRGSLSQGWEAIGKWGRDGWDMGYWPYSIVCRYDNAPAVFALATYTEGDLTLRAWDDVAERDAALDEIAAWHWRHGWPDGPEDLPPEGEPLLPHQRGPFSWDRYHLAKEMDGVVLACTVCNQRVFGGEETVNGVVSVTWIHGGPSDHEAMPAPAKVSEVTEACDFCGHTAGSLWRFTTATGFTLATEADGDTFAATHNNQWTACHPCTRYVVARDGDRLAFRTMIRIRRQVHGKSEEWYRLAEQHIRNGHTAFFLANPGDPERIRR
ncbi:MULTISPECIES: hypothetical protein [unclassified Nocardiopsis]|uniref:hypothetical protein n=1 Tax=unclassified Nocardiopsis TaxID=2649073 RepID=UPI00135B583A|nr:MULTISPECIES: hypothetical protein [unclassified Nocardiopsis]